MHVDREPVATILESPGIGLVLRWGNPVAPFVEAIRAVTYGGAWPGWDVTAYVVVAAAIALAGGTSLFRRLQGELAVVV